MIFDLKKKPTCVHCKCGFCNKEIKKKDWRFKIQYIGFRSSGVLSYHPVCLFLFLETLLRKKKVSVKSRNAFVKGFRTALLLRDL